MRRFRIPALTAVLLFLASPASAFQQIEFLRELGDDTKPAGQLLLNGPEALAVAGDRFYIADTEAHRVVVLDGEGNQVLAWGQKGEKQGQFRSPAGIAVDEQGRVFVADSGNNRIQVFSRDGGFLRSFGSRGSGPKQFSRPLGIAASRGLVYVADTGNDRVQVLTADGIYLYQITVKTKKDEMDEPVDVAVDVQNRVYVLDHGADRIRVFDAAGRQISLLGKKGKGTDGFSSARSLAVDRFGNIFVSDTGNDKFKKLDPQGRLLASFGSAGDGPGRFREAAGIDVDAAGNVFVLDSDKNTLQIFACERGDVPPIAPLSPLPSVEVAREVSAEVSALVMDKRLWGLSGDSIVAVGVIEGRKISSRGREPGRLSDPGGIAVDGRGHFWVADTGNDRLQKFSLEGTLLQVLGKTGSGEGEFRSPSAVAVSARGNIIVADTGNRRIQVFSAKGIFLGTFGKEGKLSGQFSEPVDLAVDGAENIYVADRGTGRISKFDSTGVLLWDTGRAAKTAYEFRSCENVAVSPDGEVYVLDAGQGRIVVLDAGTGAVLRAFGSEGSGPGEFRAPRGLALDSGIRLIVGDRGNRRVQIFTLRHTPAVPKGLVAQARMNEVQLSWKANAESYLSRYLVYRAEDPAGPFTELGITTEPFYVDRNLPSNRAFHYRVTAAAADGNETAPTETVSAVTPKLVPTAPKKVKAEASEKQVTLSWLPNTEPFVSTYRVYRTRQLPNFELISTQERTVFVDGPLADESLYYYQVTAVGTEGDEGPASDVVFAATPKPALSVPPIEIAKVELGELFASSYKYYETNPFGTVVIRNNTDTTYPKLTLSFSLREVMDYPAEIETEALAPGAETTVHLTSVFSNRILDITENTALQSELSLTYHVAGEPKVVRRTFPVTLYERHAMRWDRLEKVGSFVTPRDPVVADFSRSVVQQYADAYFNLPRPIVTARALFGALGVLGITYLVDPTSPYRQFSENAAAVDYLQYPRDTLARKSGDCDDLTVLFAAVLENVGIPTALVDVPGHVFLLFSTGVREQEKRSLGFDDALLVVHGGMVWIPLEMTLVGSSFTKAWRKGAETYRQWNEKGAAVILETGTAWDSFKPVTLPPADLKAVTVQRADIEERFTGELEALGRTRLGALSQAYLDVLKKNPADVKALGGLGLLYAENGLHAEALEQFKALLAVDRNSSLALNNIGNIHVLQDRMEDARQAYEAALAAAPSDPGVMVNLSRVLLRMNRKEEARQLLLDAAAIDPRVLRQYGDVAAALGVK